MTDTLRVRTLGLTTCARRDAPVPSLKDGVPACLCVSVFILFSVVGPERALTSTSKYNIGSCARSGTPGGCLATPVAGGRLRRCLKQRQKMLRQGGDTAYGKYVEEPYQGSPTLW